MMIAPNSRARKIGPLCARGKDPHHSLVHRYGSLHRGLHSLISRGGSPHTLPQRLPLTTKWLAWLWIASIHDQRGSFFIEQPAQLLRSAFRLQPSVVVMEINSLPSTSGCACTTKRSNLNFSFRMGPTLFSAHLNSSNEIWCSASNFTATSNFTSNLLIFQYLQHQTSRLFLLLVARYYLYHQWSRTYFGRLQSTFCSSLVVSFGKDLVWNRDAVSTFSRGGASFSIFIWPPPPPSLIILFHFWCTLILETYIFLNNFI